MGITFHFLKLSRFSLVYFFTLTLRVYFHLNEIESVLLIQGILKMDLKKNEEKQNNY